MFALCWHAEFVMLPYAFSHPRQLTPTGIQVTSLGRQVPPLGRHVPPPPGPQVAARAMRMCYVCAVLACRIRYDSLCFQPPAAAATN